MSQPQWGRQRDLAFDRCHDGIERPPTILEECGLCERRLFGRQNYSALARCALLSMTKLSHRY